MENIFEWKSLLSCLPVLIPCFFSLFVLNLVINS